MNSTETVITSGSAYTDIDVFACAVAYQKLCTIKGINAQIVLPGELNETISVSLKSLNIQYLQDYTDNESIKYVLVDVSNPEYFPNFVKENHIVEVYDHHWGHEDYWISRIGEGAKIEFVGSCATLIYEEFVKADLQSKIDKTTALLLYTAILSNSLNLHAQITTERDKSALKHLSKQVPANWGEKYYNEVTASILKNPERAMAHDTKNVTLGDKNYSMIQIELWNSEKFINDHYDSIVNRLQSVSTPYAFLTSPSISEGKNYLVALNEEIKLVLKKCIGATFTNNIGYTRKLWLRKEIIKIISTH